MAVRLTCAVQNYAWGKRGSSSEVAQLSASGNSKFRIDAQIPYAELWMGSHPSGPSYLADEDGSSEPALTLQSLIDAQPEILGDDIRKQFGDQLPFLFKVLSVNEALSIQAHPNKELAEQLHHLRPDLYKDPNHKPEMAIALTPFEALCGFRPLSEISFFLCHIPELCDLIGLDVSAPFIKSGSAGAPSVADLKRAFSSLMNSPAEVVKQKMSSFLNRLKELGQESKEYLDLLGRMFCTLDSQFPGDVGCFCLYFLNYMTLQPGEAIFLEANLPHAYLSGDCIECMACSDNVVRAGLTPKFKDVHTLCSMLSYEPRSAGEFLFPAIMHPSESGVFVYNPPVADFAVHRIEVQPNNHHLVGPVNSASILLVISGTAKSSDDGIGDLVRGTVLFIRANHSMNLAASGAVPLIMFRALCSV